MCNLSDAINEMPRVYSGRVTKISYSYSETDIIQRVSAEIHFKDGSIQIATSKPLNISKGDKIYFHAEQFDGDWWITDLLKVDKPKKEKLTPKQKQVNRLMEVA